MIHYPSDTLGAHYPAQSVFSFLCRLCFLLAFFFFFEWSLSALRASDGAVDSLADFERVLLRCLQRFFLRFRCSEWWPSDELEDDAVDDDLLRLLLLFDVEEEDDDEEDDDDLRRRFFVFDEAASAPSAEDSDRSAMIRSRFLRNSFSNLLFM